MKVFVSLAVGLILGLSFTGLAQTLSFPDVEPSDWFYPHVEEIKNWRIVEGNEDGTFAPARNINRAEFSKMLTLYDLRVDSKITQALDLLPKPEPVITQTLPTTMMLESNNPSSLPPECPAGWESVDSQIVFNLENNNIRRTCLTPQRCEILHLEARQVPGLCPDGWTEAHYGEFNSRNNRRTCFVCAN